MGRQLRMTVELGDWLTELGDSEPATAAEVGAALVAVLQAADPAGLGILGEPATQRPPDPRETADIAYQQLLEDLQQVRRSLSDVGSTRHRAELRLGLARDSGADPTEIADHEAQLADARQREEQLAQLSQRLQNDVDEFRTAKEAAKAMYTAAEAQLRIAEAIEAAGGDPATELAQLREDLRVAELKLQAAQSGVRMKVTRHRAAQAGTEHPAAAGRPGSPQPPSAAERPKPPRQEQPAAEPASGLLQLRADPLGSDIRILFALEPADTVTLLAVLEGPQAVSEHGAQAVRLASDLLTEMRDGGWPADIDEVLLGDADAFLARYFPDDGGSIARRAGALAATRSLSELRADQHLTINELAERSGLGADRVTAIEREGLRTASVSEAVALARVLGARLELPAGSGPVVS